MPQSAVRHLASCGTLLAIDQVRQGADGNWRLLRDVPELFDDGRKLDTAAAEQVAGTPVAGKAATDRSVDGVHDTVAERDAIAKCGGSDNSARSGNQDARSAQGRAQRSSRERLPQTDRREDRNRQSADQTGSANKRATPDKPAKKRRASRRNATQRRPADRGTPSRPAAETVAEQPPDFELAPEVQLTDDGEDSSVELRIASPAELARQETDPGSNGESVSSVLPLPVPDDDPPIPEPPTEAARASDPPDSDAAQQTEAARDELQAGAQPSLPEFPFQRQPASVQGPVPSAAARRPARRSSASGGVLAAWVTLFAIGAAVAAGIAGTAKLIEPDDGKNAYQTVVEIHEELQRFHENPSDESGWVEFSKKSWEQLNEITTELEQSATPDQRGNTLLLHVSRDLKTIVAQPLSEPGPKEQRLAGLMEQLLHHYDPSTFEPWPKADGG